MRCQTVHCDTACGDECGGWDHPKPDCEACARNGCCAQQKAGSTDLDAVELVVCQHRCSNVTEASPCMRDCARYLAGQDADSVEYTCAANLGCDNASACTAPLWSCVGNMLWPKPASSVPAIDLSVQALSADVKAPIPGVTVAACNDGPAPCDPTGADGGWTYPHGTTDANGVAVLSGIYRAYDGYFADYLDVRGPGIPENLTYFNSPPLEAKSEGRWLVTSGLEDGVHPPGMPRLPKHGDVLLIAEDCMGDPAAGVRISSPQQDANTEVSQETGPTGVATLFNMPAVKVEIRATVVKTGQTWSRHVWVREGAVTEFGFSPTPLGQ